MNSAKQNNIKLTEQASCAVEFKSSTPYPGLVINTKLDNGSFSTVYGGFLGKRKVAIKKITPTENFVKDFKKFNNECEVQHLLEHPRIVTLIAIYIEANAYCLVLERMNSSLCSVLKNQNHGHTATKLWQIVHDIASALEYMHSKFRVHNDVKPENILLTAKNRAKLADFGSVTSVDHPTRAGTVEYLAPECFSEPSGRNEKSDVYALGVVMWELFFGKGKRPFSNWEKSKLKRYIAHKHGKETIPDDAPPSYITTINGCWAPNENRFSATQLMKNIEPYLNADMEPLFQTGESSSLFDEESVRPSV